MTTIEKIRAEIERRREANMTKNGFPAGTLCAVRIEAYDELLAFLDTLQEPKDVDLDDEIKEWTDLMVGASFPEQDGDFISEEDYRSVIRQTAIHFLGINSKK